MGRKILESYSEQRTFINLNHFSNNDFFIKILISFFNTISWKLFMMLTTPLHALCKFFTLIRSCQSNLKKTTVAVSCLRDIPALKLFTAAFWIYRKDFTVFFLRWFPLSTEVFLILRLQFLTYSLYIPRLLYSIACAKSSQPLHTPYHVSSLS